MFSVLTFLLLWLIEPDCVQKVVLFELDFHPHPLFDLTKKNTDLLVGCSFVHQALCDMLYFNLTALKSMNDMLVLMTVLPHLYIFRNGWVSFISFQQRAWILWDYVNYVFFHEFNNVLKRAPLEWVHVQIPRSNT